MTLCKHGRDESCPICRSERISEAVQAVNQLNFQEIVAPTRPPTMPIPSIEQRLRKIEGRLGYLEDAIQRITDVIRAYDG
jgi:hypothetical protein